MTATPIQSDELQHADEPLNGSGSGAIDPIEALTAAAGLEREGKLTEARVAYQAVVDAEDDTFRENALKAIAALDAKLGIAPVAEPGPEFLFRGQDVVRDEAIATEAEAVAAAPARTQGFANWPIFKKQLVGLLGLQLFSVLAVTGVGAALLNDGGNRQLRQQAQSELAVAGIQYDIKINQMGFGFRGQSDNAAVIAAASADAANQSISGELRQQVANILKNEIQARNIEYATLVGRDRRIIVSANADRAGEEFDPNGLVSQVFDNPEQIKTSQIVSRSELQAEDPPQLDGVEGQDALIRYTVTPVKANGSGEVVGALVSGDIVNGKSAIPAQTIAAFENGYAAVYAVLPEGNFQLATAQLEGANGTTAELALPNQQVLEKAIAAPSGLAVARVNLKGQPFVVAVETIRDVANRPTALLVRGTPKTQLQKALWGNWLAQLGFALVLGIVGYVLARYLANTIAKPVQQLQAASRAFSQGDRQARAEVTTTEEIGQLAVSFNEMADSVALSEAEILNLASQRQREANEQRLERERLQKGVIDLLLDIEGARDGDLTVQAALDEGEMGTVADAFNSTITNLRGLVQQVKGVAEGVQASASMNEISVQELSNESNQQVESVMAALFSAEEMSQSISSVSASAQETADVARQALEFAYNGDQAMTQTVESIEGIRESVADTSKKVKRLAESSQEISKIVGIISSISEKTNLLAFNASIEAARAGENGQGFRVVADEVRRLAERVTEATKDIEQLVSTIQDETAEVLQTMEKSTTEVVAGTQQVTATKETLRNLAEISLRIDALVQGITASTVSQTEASQVMTQTMQEVAAIAQNTSERSQTVSTSLQELVLSARMLQDSTAQFRVEEA